MKSRLGWFYLINLVATSVAITMRFVRTFGSSNRTVAQKLLRLRRTLPTSLSGFYAPWSALSIVGEEANLAPAGLH